MSTRKQRINHTLAQALDEYYHKTLRELFADNKAVRGGSANLQLMADLHELEANALFSNAEQPAMLSEVRGKLFPFPEDKFAEATRKGTMRAFNRGTKQKGFHFDEAKIWASFEQTYAELQRMKREKDFARAPIYKGVILSQTRIRRANRANVDELLALVRRVATSRGQAQVDRWEMNIKKGLESGRVWPTHTEVEGHATVDDTVAIPANMPLRAPLSTFPNVVLTVCAPSPERPRRRWLVKNQLLTYAKTKPGSIDADEADYTADIDEGKQFPKDTDNTEWWEWNQGLAVKPICRPLTNDWRDLVVHFAPDKRTPGGYTPSKNSSLLDIAVHDYAAYEKLRECGDDEPAVRRQRSKVIKTKKEATVETATYLYHRTFGKVKHIRTLANKVDVWIEKKGERTLVQVADLSLEKWPKVKKSRKKPIVQAAQIVTVTGHSLVQSPCMLEGQTRLSAARLSPEN